MADMIVIPMPTPRSPNGPRFKGERVTDFLDCLEVAWERCWQLLMEMGGGWGQRENWWWEAAVSTVVVVSCCVAGYYYVGCGCVHFARG
jgi:hypothetical protein